MKSYWCVFTQLIHCILLKFGYLSKPLSMCIQIIYFICFDNYNNVSVILLMTCLCMIICLIHICIVLGSSHSILFDWLLPTLSLILYKIRAQKSIFLLHMDLVSYLCSMFCSLISLFSFEYRWYSLWDFLCVYSSYYFGRSLSCWCSLLWCLMCSV